MPEKENFAAAWKTKLIHVSGKEVLIFFIPLSILFFLIVSPIARDGMFIDGLAYVNIAKNMSLGIGSFWQPVVDMNNAPFYEHPPLVFALQSLLFRLIGNHSYTEDVYNLLVLSGVLFFMYEIWTRVAGASNKGLFFFPFTLFVLSQENQLRYANSMLECTMTLVSLVTVSFFLRFVSNRLLSYVICGVGASLAFLCKGPTGLFLLATPCLFHLVVHRKLRLISLLVPLLAMGVFFGLLFLLFPAAYPSLSQYLNQQVIAALAGERIENIANSRLAILHGLIMLNIPQILLCALVYFGLRSKADQVSSRYGLFLLAVGASAILPIMVSIKQASYYQVPSLPYFYLGLSFLLLNSIYKILRINTLSARKITGINVGLLLIFGASLLNVVYSFNTVDRRDVAHIKHADHIAHELAGDQLLNLKIIGERAAFKDSYSHAVPAFLNRRHDIYVASSGEAADFTLYISDDGIAPIGLSEDNIVYKDGKYTLTYKD